ncbi:hypothetical protein [Modestobacter sp. SYSU DS0875]
MLRHNAAALVGKDWSVPVVLAGNAAVRDEVAAVLSRRRRAAPAPARRGRLRARRGRRPRGGARRPLRRGVPARRAGRRRRGGRPGGCRPGWRGRRGRSPGSAAARLRGGQRERVPAQGPEATTAKPAASSAAMSTAA